MHLTNLCQQILLEVIAEYQQLYETIDTQRTAVEQLRQWLTLLMERNQSGRWLNCRFVTQLSVQMQQISPAMQNQLSDFWQWYEGIYQAWLLQCGQEDQQDKLSARTLICAIFGAIWLEKSCPNPYSITDVIQHQLQFILPED